MLHNCVIVLKGCKLCLPSASHDTVSHYTIVYGISYVMLQLNTCASLILFNDKRKCSPLDARYGFPKSS